MISIQQDPKDPNRLVLSIAATMYLDRVLLETLNTEVESAIRAQARKDLRGNKAVRTQIADAATRLLLGMLGQAVGAPEEAPVTTEIADGKA